MEVVVVVVVEGGVKSGCAYITRSDLRAVLQNIGEDLTEEESRWW